MDEGVRIRKDRVTDSSIVLSCGRPALLVVVQDGMREPNSVPIELWSVWYGEVVRSILCKCANRYSRVAGGLGRRWCQRSSIVWNPAPLGLPDCESTSWF